MSALEEKVLDKYDGFVIRDFLKEELELSSRLIKKAAIEKRILINDEAVRMRAKVHSGDTVKVILERDESQDIIPEDIELDIVFENSDILVLNKKPFMVVHPTRNHQIGTLSNGVTGYFKKTNQNCIVRLVNRLDMNTSGLIIIGKNQYAHMYLSKEMEKNAIYKKYIAIVHGNIKEKSGTIDRPIYRPFDELGIPKLRRVVDKRGQRSITHYKVLESYEGFDVVECILETGRTHQIRVHLSSLGHPIYGDFLYGEGDNEVDLIERQALHAYSLKFKDPKTKEFIELSSEIPKDMIDLKEKLINK
ncbi:RluA family pseudouridine synthase [Clostridium chrysemydis]|uniref:RluA family pseudouridine synthase n=1 Tax=Clostridium chrysemydis TaxID=2665504 RepID=UPI00188336A3|nr:RluA family pseudouridine synthase [Clostridium chrysemydis]